MKGDPILFVVSGPSGCGKGTMISHIIDTSDVRKVVNYTTRSPRPGEVDGVHYNFVSEEKFMRLLSDGCIFEYERVYDDYYYGSPSSVLSGGGDCVIELDYKGHRKYRQSHPRVVSIFLLPPSAEEMQKRIRDRAEEDNMPSRLDNAAEQLLHAGEYDYVLLNDDLDRCRRDVEAVVRAEQVRRWGELLMQKYATGNSD
ncbi:MAG: guanylate kinase [Bacillota bacterium]